MHVTIRTARSAVVMGTDPGTERDMQYEHLTTQKVVASVIVDWLKPTRGATAPGGEAGRIRDLLLRSNSFERNFQFLIAGRAFTIASQVDKRDDGGCAGQIVFGLVDSPKHTVPLGVKLEHEARNGCGRLTLTFNPSEMLAGTHVAPTLLSQKSTGIPFPSSSSHVAGKLLRLGFDLLDALYKMTHRGDRLFKNEKGEGIGDADICIESIEWETLVLTTNARRFLEHLTLIFVPPSRRNGKVVRLGELLKLKADFKNDAKTGELGSVTLKKIQGDRRNVFSIELSRLNSRTRKTDPNASEVESSRSDRHVRLRLIAHQDGVATIISAAQQKCRNGGQRVVLVDDDFTVEKAASRRLWMVGQAVEVLGNVVTAQHKLSRFSFGHWLAKKVLCEVLHLDVIARFSRGDLDKLVRQNDAIAKAWRASSSLSVNMKALAKAAKVDIQTVYNRRREWRRMYRIDIALPHAFYLTLVTVSPVDAMDAEARAALSETLSHPDAQRTFELLGEAAKDFDQGHRTIIGSAVDDAQTGKLGKFQVQTIEAAIKPVPGVASSDLRRRKALISSKKD